MAADTPMGRIDSVPEATIEAVLAMDTSSLGALAKKKAELVALAGVKEELAALAEKSAELLALLDDGTPEGETQEGGE